MKGAGVIFLFVLGLIGRAQDQTFHQDLKSISDGDTSVMKRLERNLNSDQANIVAQSHYLFGKYFLRKHESDTAIYFFEKSASKFKTGGNDSMFIKSLIAKARAQYNTGDVIGNEASFNEALQHFAKYDNERLKVSVLLGLGWAYREQANHTGALDKYLEAMRIAKRLEDDDLISDCYGKIAVVYHVKRDFPQAFKNYQKSLKISESLNDSSAIESLYNNIGLLYYYQKKLDSALYYYELSRDMARNNDAVRGMAIANENIGLVLNEQGKHQAALSTFDESLSIWSGLKDDYGIGQVLAYKLDAYNDLEMYDSTIVMGKEALIFAIRAGTKHVERDIYEYLELAHTGIGDYQNSHHYYHRFVTLRDSLAAINQDKELTNLEMKHNYAEKYYQDSLLTVKQQSELKLKSERDQLAAEKEINETRTTRNYFLIGLIALGAILILILYVLRQKQASNKLVNLQNLVLQEKNREITDSINYARRIQSAILPSQEYLNHILPHHFIWYHPKDIVAGDFYWVEEVNGKVYVAVADCTGHGVPGAMVSVVCSNALNKVVLEEKVSDPSLILQRTTEVVVERFSKSEKDIKDGMDIALMVLDRSRKMIEFSGANNSLVFIDRSGQQTTLKGTRRSIGVNLLDMPFEKHVMPFEGGEHVYMYTDGYPDQFGGRESKKGKKFKSSRLKQLLQSISSQDLSTQKNKLKESFLDWQGDFEQVDDVCLMGIEL